MIPIKDPENAVFIKPSLFEQLYNIDISNEVEDADFGFGPVKVLTWSRCWRLIRTFDDKADFKIFENRDGLPFFASDLGVMVHVSLTIKGRTEDEWTAVEAPKNGQVTVEDIRNFHQRALVKAAGRHGLGLKIWEGENKKTESSSSVPINSGSGLRSSSDAAPSVKPKGKGKPISEGQVRRFYALGKTHGWSGLELNDLLKSAYGYTKPEDIAWPDYEAICNTVQAGPKSRGHKDFTQPPAHDDDDIGNPF